MKRILPFLIIAIVGVATVGIATAVYRVKTRPAPTQATSPRSEAKDAKIVEQETEDPSLHARGPRNAPITLEIYGDFQCPSCAVASAIIDDLEKEYGNKLRVVFYEFPLAMHKHALVAAMAAEAAGLQGKFWEMHDALYQFQPVWSQATTVDTFFDAYAETIGLDVMRFRQDRQSPELQMRVKAEGEAGAARGVQNTPTMFINGVQLRTAFDRESLRAALDQALAAKKNP